MKESNLVFKLECFLRSWFLYHPDSWFQAILGRWIPATGSEQEIPFCSTDLPCETCNCLSVCSFLQVFPGGSVVKNLPANVGDGGWTPGSRRAPGEGNGNPLQYSCLGNPMDRGAWRATVHGVAKSQTWLSLSLPSLVSKSLFSAPVSLLCR